CTTLAAKQTIKVCGLSEFEGLSDEELSGASSGMLSDCNAFSGTEGKTLGTFKTAEIVGTGLGERMKIVGLLDFANFETVDPTDSAEDDIAKYYRHLRWTDMAGASGNISNEAAKKILSDIHMKITALFDGKDGATLRFCTEGRDLSQIMARSTRGRDTSVASRRSGKMKTEARFPKLLDGVIEKILEKGKEVAQINYTEKLSESMEKYNENLREREAKGEGGYIDNSLGICWHDGKSGDGVI
ncbi:MAG: hypothetical protein LBL21_03160, partial [Rickettsiales bacterium]|nr:hypothetical protein [Rickettsiales bacterium]